LRSATRSECSGARIIVTLLHEMERRGVGRGLATLCVSGGMGWRWPSNGYKGGYEGRGHSRRRHRPEVIAEAVTVLETVGGVELEQLPWGADHYLRTGVTVPPGGYDMLRTFDAVLVGALGDPRVPDKPGTPGHPSRHAVRAGSLRQLPPRAPARRSPVPAPRSHASRRGLRVMRENTEGLYVGIGGRFKADTDDEELRCRRR